MEKMSNKNLHKRSYANLSPYQLLVLHVDLSLSKLDNLDWMFLLPHNPFWTFIEHLTFNVVLMMKE